MKLNVNGEIKLVESGENKLSLSNIITKLGFNPKAVVVELNGTIVPQKQWNNLLIKENDNLEIVTIVGGGS